MALDIACPACGRTLRVADQHAGKQIRCPACQQVSVAPRGPQDAATPATSPATEQATNPPVWHVRTPEGAAYGPIGWSEVLGWVAEGRIAADCELAESGQGPWQPAASFLPGLLPTPVDPAASLPTNTMHSGSGAHPWQKASSEAAAAGNLMTTATTATPAASYVAPHRAALILVLGLLGFVVGCPVFSVIAWVLGSRDLREMRSGRMDRSGEGPTLAGMVLGIIVSIFWLFTAFILLAIALLIIAAQW